MPQAIPPLVAKIGLTGAAAFAAETVLSFATIAGFNALGKKLAGGQKTSPRARQLTSRGEISSDKVVYGEDLVSGPVAFLGSQGPQKEFFWYLIPILRGQVDALLDVHLDDQVIFDMMINGGATGGGDVDSGVFGPIGGTNVVKIKKYLGDPNQDADPDLAAAFPTLFQAGLHRGRGLTYIAVRFHAFNSASEELWQEHEPGDQISVLTRGARVYDPRDPAQSSGDESTWKWSSSPPLCLAEYCANPFYGLGADIGGIDWAMVGEAADYCDELVETNIGERRRFTCNGTLFATDTHQDNIASLLSCMAAPSPVHTGGKWRIRAGGGFYEGEHARSITEDDLAGVPTQADLIDNEDYFNAATGIFLDRASGFQERSTPKTTRGDQVAVRDDGREIPRQIALPMTNTLQEAHRVLWYELGRTDYARGVEWPGKLALLQYEPGQIVRVDSPTMGFDERLHVLEAMTIDDQGTAEGPIMTLRRTDPSIWTDPPAASYPADQAQGGSGVIVGDVVAVPPTISYQWTTNNGIDWNLLFSGPDRVVEFRNSDDDSLLASVTVRCVCSQGASDGGNVTLSLLVSHPDVMFIDAGGAGTPYQEAVIQHSSGQISSIFATADSR
ncbi:MAG: hypothetical protein AAF515_05020 [Pseudomonadota bacterium]